MEHEEGPLSELGRFAEPGLLILISLANGPKHGYAMMEDIAQLTQTRIGPGTLYGALTRLEGQGFVEPLPPQGRRRPYRLTESGASFLGQALESLQGLAQVGQQRLVHT